MPIYTASRISRDSNVLYPDVLVVDALNVTYYKGRPIGYETLVIPRSSISGVWMDSGLFFADIIISSSGRPQIEARGFKKSVARQIVNSLT